MPNTSPLLLINSCFSNAGDTRQVLGIFVKIILLIDLCKKGSNAKTSSQSHYAF